MFLISNELEQLECKLGKNIGILKHAGKVRKYVTSEIFPPLHTMLKNYHFVSNVISSWWEGGHFAQSFPMSEIELKNVLSIMAMQFTSTHCITTQCRNLGQVIASKIIRLLIMDTFMIESLY